VNQQSASASPPIRHRRVHAFSGFDPRGAAHDHHLAQTEAHRVQPSGLRLEVGPRLRSGPHGHTWTVRCHSGDTEVCTTHVRMGWDDLVRQHWRYTPLHWLRTAGRVYAALVREVGIGRLYRLHPPALFAALWPLCGGPGGAWLLRIYGFLWQLGRAQVPALDARRTAWVEQIIALQESDPVEEVVLCGHSVGALLAVSTAAALQNEPRWQRLQAGRRTGLVTLGGCYVGLTLRDGAGAQAFRDALVALSQAPQWAWLDVTARIDPLCLDGAHPLAGTAEHTTLPGPVNRSARFFQMYSPERWKTLRRDKQRTHGLYLMTPERTGNFDLHDLLYGPRPFEQHLGLPLATQHTP
jgi:pimeloyl-ACP methyl ester carboxylesterase